GVHRALTRSPRVSRPAPSAGAISDELLVVYRSAPLGAPGIGTAAMGAAARGRGLGDDLRAQVAASARRVPSPLSVVGVSPALLSARVRVADHARVAETIA